MMDGEEGKSAPIRTRVPFDVSVRESDMGGLPLIESCEGCAGCCRGRTLPPFTGADDPEFLALPEPLQELLRGQLSSLRVLANEEAACAWLDRQTGLCRHYEWRPAACRDFERGSFYCQLLHRKWCQ